MRMIHYDAATTILAAVVLAGCSSGPEISVRSSGTVPASGGYALVGDAPKDVVESVSGALARRGLMASGSPDYVVQVSYAMRPAGTGLLVPEGEDPQWLRGPDFHHRKRPVATLGISIAEVAEGRELYRSWASGRPPSKGEAWPPLLQAIFAEPTRDSH